MVVVIVVAMCLFLIVVIVLVLRVVLVTAIGSDPLWGSGFVVVVIAFVFGPCC